MSASTASPGRSRQGCGRRGRGRRDVPPSIARPGWRSAPADLLLDKQAAAVTGLEQRP